MSLKNGQRWLSAQNTGHWAARWKAQTNPLRYGGAPNQMLLEFIKLGQTLASRWQHSHRLI